MLGLTIVSIYNADVTFGDVLPRDVEFLDRKSKRLPILMQKNNRSWFLDKYFNYQF